MLPDIKEVKMFKVAKCCEEEKHQDRDDFTFRHLHGAFPEPFSVAGTDSDVFTQGKNPCKNRS
jgi:hypothetical protein